MRGSHRPREERLLEAVEESYRSNHRVDRLARRLNLSPAHLHRLTAKDFGTSPKRLITERVMIEAKRLLDHSEKSSAQIACDLGFSDPAYFSRAFSRWAGHSPGAYRQARKVQEPARD